MGALGGRFARKFFRPPPDFYWQEGLAGRQPPPARFTSTGRQILTAVGGLGEAGAPLSEHRRQNSAGFSGFPPKLNVSYRKVH